MNRRAPAWRLESHVDEDDLALYVLGGLEGDRLDAVEAHVMACESCAAELAREARLEAAFDAVAARAMAHAHDHGQANGSVVHLARSPRRAIRSGRFMGGALGALAAAAGIVLMFAQTSHADTLTVTSSHGGAFDGAPGMMGDISGALSFEGRAERGDNLDGG
jgi:anti-sigma factor RsiW